MTIRAKFYDGKTARPHEVSVTFMGESLHILSEDKAINLTWGADEIEVLEQAVTPKPAKLTSIKTPEARLFIQPGEDWQTLKQRLPKGAFPHISLPVSFPAFIGYAGLSVAVLIFLFFSVPHLLEYGAYLIPKAAEDKLGQYAIKTIIEGEICSAPKGVKSLETLTQKLQDQTTRSISYNVRVVHNDDMLNALAAPGGHLIIFSGVIAKAENPDEVAGVLAHEMAHIEKRHSTRGLVRDLGISMTLQMMFGGDANIPRLAGFMNQMRYSREDEREADEVGQAMLEGAGIDPAGMALFFKRLKKEQGVDNDKEGEEDWPEFYSYFSTHPQTTERIEYLENVSARKSNYKPALSKRAWKDLKKICTDTQKSKTKQ